MLPKSVIEYNQIILEYLSEYNTFALYLSVSIFACGICMEFLTALPILSRYRLVQSYAGYGLRCGLWIFLIWAIYKIYTYSRVIFMFSPILAFLASRDTNMILENL